MLFVDLNKIPCALYPGVSDGDKDGITVKITLRSYAFYQNETERMKPAPLYVNYLHKSSTTLKNYCQFNSVRQHLFFRINLIHSEVECTHLTAYLTIAMHKHNQNLSYFSMWKKRQTENEREREREEEQEEVAWISSLMLSLTIFHFSFLLLLLSYFFRLFLFDLILLHTNAKHVIHHTSKMSGEKKVSDRDSACE